MIVGGGRSTLGHHDGDDPMTATLHRGLRASFPPGSGRSRRRRRGTGRRGVVQGHRSRARMKQLMQRSNGPAIRDTLLWFALLAVFGGVGAWAFVAGNLVWIPLLAVYGVLYGSVSDSRWHEPATGRRQDPVDERRGVPDRLLHRSCAARRCGGGATPPPHRHADRRTATRRSSPCARRPSGGSLNFFGLVDVPRAMWQMVVHASGRLTDEEQTYVPAPERRRRSAKHKCGS